MPVTQPEPVIDALRRFAVSTLAYAVAIGLVASALPTLIPAALLPEPAPVVARIPAEPQP